MDMRGGDDGCCFVVQGVTNTTEVTYVVVTGTRELGDLLAEGERGVKDNDWIAWRWTRKNWLSKRKGKGRRVKCG